MENYLDKYNQIKINTGKVSNEDFSVMVAEDVLLPDHIENIYKIVNSTPESKTELKEWAGHKAWHVRLGKEFEDRVTEVAKKYLGDVVVLNLDYSFARYTPEYGFECKLFPHYDTRPSQRLTFDIQLSADEDWAVVVENVPYSLKNNQALIFSGTQQIHWREKKKIKKDSKIDMIFCHLQYIEDRPLDPGQSEKLDERARFLMDATGINNAVELYSEQGE